MFTSPVRFSGHGKGPREAAGVIEVQDPATDIPKIVQDALQMRQQGPSEVFQRQAIVDDLIAGGMKPKQAYKEADKIMQGFAGKEIFLLLPGRYLSLNLLSSDMYASQKYSVC